MANVNRGSGEGFHKQLLRRAKYARERVKLNSVKTQYGELLSALDERRKVSELL